MKVRLIHWSAEEARERAGWLARAGHKVTASPFTPQEVRGIKASLPEAIVIDLSRLPSQGRDAALLIRQTKTTRHIPLVFAEGDPEKVAAIQKILPDAVYGTWPRIAPVLKRAVSGAPKDPVVPGVFAGYASASTAKKLGIKAGSTVALVNAPPRFEHELGDLPPDVTLRRNPRSRRNLTLWFVRSRQDLEEGMTKMKDHAVGAGLWIVWPKRKSTAGADVSQVIVRKAGLAAGIVDFKIAALDAEWSGLRFTQRRRFRERRTSAMLPSPSTCCDKALHWKSAQRPCSTAGVTSNRCWLQTHL